MGLYDWNDVYQRLAQADSVENNQSDPAAHFACWGLLDLLPLELVETAKPMSPASWQNGIGPAVSPAFIIRRRCFRSGSKPMDVLSYPGRRRMTFGTTYP